MKRKRLVTEPGGLLEDQATKDALEAQAASPARLARRFLKIQRDQLKDIWEGIEQFRKPFEALGEVVLREKSNTLI